MDPAWRDPRYLTSLHLRQLEEHEQTIRVREREREWRRMQPLMPVTVARRSDDFEGCVE